MIIAQQVNHIACHMKKTSRQNIIKHREKHCQANDQAMKLYGMEHVKNKKSFIQIVLNQLAAGKNTPHIKTTGLPYVLKHMIEINKYGGQSKRHNVFTDKRI